MNLRRLLVLTAVASLTACGNGSDELAAQTEQTVPVEFRAACGKPGSTVEVRTERATVRQEDCDLRGVILRHRGAGAVVPSGGGQIHSFQDFPVGAGPESVSAVVSVDPEDGDVTFIYTSR
jgi:hypothetical protein